MLSDLYNGGIRAAGLTALARLVRDAGLIVCYHNVVPNRCSDGDVGLHLPLSEFTRQIDWIADRYDVVSLTELAGRLATGRSVRRLAVLTFDDGYGGVFEYGWPVLRKRGIPATMFVPSHPIDVGEAFWWDHPSIARGVTTEHRRSLLNELRGDAGAIAAAAFGDDVPALPASHLPASWATISRAAEAGLDLGVHSATHRNLTCLSDRDLQAEISESRERLHAQCGVRSQSFAYPYGIFDARVRDAVRRAGYRAAVTLEYGLNSPGVDACALRRISIPSGISAAAFETWVSGLRPWFRRER
jgi:peptidoglycan/xylan/chitin deacetylase (PgdA/CDA1 family)